jgi:hypothetical protein
MKKIILTIILFAIAIALTFMSIAPYNKIMLLCTVLLFSIVAGLLMSLTLIAWYEGNFRERLAQAASIGFPLAAGSFILGYAYIIIESLIRK